jgi:hypothetical protein
MGVSARFAFGPGLETGVRPACGSAARGAVSGGAGQTGPALLRWPFSGQHHWQIDTGKVDQYGNLSLWYQVTTNLSFSASYNGDTRSTPTTATTPTVWDQAAVTARPPRLLHPNPALQRPERAAPEETVGRSLAPEFSYSTAETCTQELTGRAQQTVAEQVAVHGSGAPSLDHRKHRFALLKPLEVLAVERVGPPSSRCRARTADLSERQKRATPATEPAARSPPRR